MKLLNELFARFDKLAAVSFLINFDYLLTYNSGNPLDLQSQLHIIQPKLPFLFLIMALCSLKQIKNGEDADKHNSDIQAPIKGEKIYLR